MVLGDCRSFWRARLVISRLTGFVPGLGSCLLLSRGSVVVSGGATGYITSRLYRLVIAKRNGGREKKPPEDPVQFRSWAQSWRLPLAASNFQTGPRNLQPKLTELSPHLVGAPSNFNTWTFELSTLNVDPKMWVLNVDVHCPPLQGLVP